MDTSLHVIDIKDLKKYFPTPFDDNLSDDFFISDIKYKEELPLLNEPCRFNGYLALFCISGSLTAEINLKTYEIKEHSLIICVPGNIGRIYKMDSEAMKDIHFVAIAMSESFMAESKMDLVRLFDESIAVLHNPCINLSDEEMAICGKYLQLIDAMLKVKSTGMREVVSQLLSSAFYFFGSLWAEQIEHATLENLPQEFYGANTTARSKLIFERFLKLVRDYHTQERGMGFYADKLCLTPKYLSKVIKNVSGQSGPDWIDSFVILEAKNMLKYSDMPIKEIVYKLNFPNSSVFYKFFKSHTGFTPSEYRG